MSSSIASDILQQVLQWLRTGGGLIGPHNHSVAQGGPIVTDVPITATNPLQPAIISRTQVLNQNFNADLWRGHRIYSGTTAPIPSTSILNFGDFWFDGSNLWNWNGSKWVKPATGGLSSVNFDVNGSLVGSQSTLNLIQGSNTTITGINNVGASRVDVTFSSTGGGSTPHALLDGVIDNDTVAQAPVKGMMIYGNGTPLWAGLGIGSSNQVLTVVGGVPSWQPAGAATTPSLLRNLIALGT